MPTRKKLFIALAGLLVAMLATGGAIAIAAVTSPVNLCVPAGGKAVTSTIRGGCPRGTVKVAFSRQAAVDALKARVTSLEGSRTTLLTQTATLALDVRLLKNNTDVDNDGLTNIADNCVLVSNASQTDSDMDGLGDACDSPPNDTDVDGDNVNNNVDNCAFVANLGQEDLDADGIGSACDPRDLPDQPDNDFDGDGVANPDDNCPFQANAPADVTVDSDTDGMGDACDLNVG